MSLFDFLCFGFDDKVDEKRLEGGLDTRTKSEDATETEREEPKSALQLHASQSSIIQHLSQESDGKPKLNSWCLKFLEYLGMCCMMTYTICPPVPCCIVRKAAFRPPPKGKSYKILVDDKKTKQRLELKDAREV